MANSPLVASDSERALIGTALRKVSLGLLDASARVFRRIPADYFAAPEHRAVWSAVLALAAENVDPSPAAVRARLAESDAGQHAGLVIQLASAEPEPLEYHAEVLRDRAMRRRLYEAAEMVGRKTLDLTAGLSDVVDESERLVMSATSTTQLASTPGPVKRRLMAVAELITTGGYKGTPTGFVDLDTVLTGGGVLPGQLVVVAGATGMGKSALATGIAAHVAIEGKRGVGYFSIEMTETDNTLRLLCHEARADLKAITEGRATEHDLANITRATALLNGAPLYLYDQAITVNQVRSAARRLKAEYDDLAVLIIDHIHDMEGPGDNRREQVGGIGRGLKALAKELNVAVIAVAQLSRGPAKRPDPTPRLDDLKESGDLENVADTAWLLYRPEYYMGPTDQDGNDIRGAAKLIVAKQRNGQTGVVRLRWVPHCVRFDNDESRRRQWEAA